MGSGAVSKRTAKALEDARFKADPNCPNGDGEQSQNYTLGPSAPRRADHGHIDSSPCRWPARPCPTKVGKSIDPDAQRNGPPPPLEPADTPETPTAEALIQGRTRLEAQ